MLKNLFDNAYYLNRYYFQIYIKSYHANYEALLKSNILKITKVFLYNKFYKIRKYNLFFLPKFQYTNKIYWYNKFFFFKLWKKKKI